MCFSTNGLFSRFLYPHDIIYVCNTYVFFPKWTIFQVPVSSRQ